jgi:hypothetical protein
MKKLFTTAACITAFITSVFAQSAKFEPAMKKTLVELDSAKTQDDLQNVSNSFERIATAEKDQWLPYYYAAYSLLMKSYLDKDKSHIDPVMDKADLLLANAEALSTNNSEINTLKAMNIQRRMEVDMSRFQTLGSKCTQLVRTAEKQDANNPRAWMFDAQMTYYTPSAFGGDKAKGKEMMQKALALFDSNKA